MLKNGVPLNAVLSQHASLAGVDLGHTYSHALTGYAAKLSPDALAAVKADQRVAFVSRDREVRIAAQTLPTGINRIDGDLSSKLSGNGSGSVNVNVAVIDTGIDSSHPDLNVVGGKGCTTGIGFIDGNGHGSHVAGTIAANDDANGVVGVAPGLDACRLRRGTDRDGRCRLQRPARRRRGKHVPKRHRRSVRELQQLRDARGRSEPHDRGAGRLHQLDVHARPVQHAFRNQHGVAAPRLHRSPTTRRLRVTAWASTETRRDPPAGGTTGT